MENSRLQDAASTSVNVTVGRRSREYLTEREVERLMEASLALDGFAMSRLRAAPRRWPGHLRLHHDA
jgi:hypothetical protein